ncbi:MAG TPA: zinc ABC transporter substrate-binding protein [Cytophagaceae bacterium]|jgi:manganese/zinc/iron transport system substrate-binding protein|nr:zinc ABC transporter substrate-binding protein [Cytophagaceae bacterium]
MKKKRVTIGILIVLVLSINACTSTKETNDKLKIVAVGTTGMIADAIGNIVGEKGEVQVLMGPGVDPHLYKVTQGDLQKLQNADLVFYNGLHLEGKMSEVLEKLSKKKNVIAISDGINKNRIRMLDDKGTVKDPHIWFNVSLWKEAVLFASKELQKADSVNHEFYKSNTLNFANQLDSLDEWVKVEINTIPEQNRLLITAHDAFGYFGEAYGIEVKGLQGISTVSDYGLNDVTALVNLISGRKIKAIFIETSVSDKSIKAVVEGCQAKGHQVIIGGTLYSDAMGQAGTPEGTYIGMVKSNVTKIVKALK